MAEKKDGAAKEGGDGKSPKTQKKRDDKKASRWTVELCAKFAKRFETEDAWAAGAPSSYKAAVARGHLAECVKHMKTPAKKKKTA